VPPIAIEPDETEFGYVLDPVGEVSVRFEPRKHYGDERRMNPA
jgi:hypothetical protein